MAENQANGRHPARWALVLLALGTAQACAAEEQSAAQPSVDDAHYRYGPASRDGIGKSYMGREISHVMGHLGAGWLERASRENEERTDLLLDQLPLAPGNTAVDLGAGTGYFTLPMARKVGSTGTVLAVDIQQEMLDIVTARIAEEGLENVRTVLASARDPMLPPDVADLVLLVDAYHEFSYPREVMTAVFDALRSGGKVILIEYRGEDPRVPIKRLHKMTARQAILEMQAVGLQWVETLDFLPQQHFLVFQKP
jgi:SAM-dependent methyltransferase